MVLTASLFNSTYYHLAFTPRHVQAYISKVHKQTKSFGIETTDVLTHSIQTKQTFITKMFTNCQ